MLSINPPSRLHGLDYLRGLAAFGIMAYHYSSWIFGEQAASSLLGKLGIYGVAIFYILSGQTLSYIYSSRLQLMIADLREFYKKRLFRIFPLLWLATLLSIVLSKHIPNGVDVFLNLTGLFGLVRWDVYFATGAWSIGNEICFYLTFPLLVFLLSKNRIGLFILGILVTILCCYFAFYALKPNIPLANQWHLYTNPLNQFIFFFSGVLMGKLIQPNSIKPSQSLLFGAAGIAAFVLLPIHGNAITLATGPNRLFFIASCLLICYGFFRTGQAPFFFDKPLSLLGQASYSLYLLHPLVYAVVKAVFKLTSKIILLPDTAVFFTSTVLSLVISCLSYKYFESYFTRISHKSEVPSHYH